MDRLKRLRKQKGLSQARLAARAELDPSTVNQIEGGQRNASPVTLRKLAAALDVRLSELLEEDAPKAPSHSSPAAPEDQAAEEWHALAKSLHTVRRWGSDLLDLFYRGKLQDQGHLAEKLANLYEELFAVGFERYHASRTQGTEEELAELSHALEKLIASSQEELERAAERERDPQMRGKLFDLAERQRARRAG